VASPHRSWLAQGAETLAARLASRDGPDAPDCDVLIVGSGYGGAVAAARLAGATIGDGQDAPPARIWLLERGLEHPPGSFPSRFAELPGHVRFSRQDGQPPRGSDEGLFDLRLGGEVSVLVANGLGGGSLINAGVMLRPDDDVFESGWPKAVTKASLDDAYGQALAMLQPQRVPRGRETGKLKVLRAVARKLKAPSGTCPVTANLSAAAAPSAAGVELASCTLCGDCATGCNQGAKGSLDTSYLAYARARGVEMFCGGVVERVEKTSGDVWHVHWHFTDHQLRPHGGEAFVVRARRVVLAAGALGSTEILLRSRAAGLAVSGRLGERFSINGDCIAAGVGHRQRVGIVADPESDPADAQARFVGPTITGVARVPAAGGKPGFAVEEFAVPAALRDLLGEVAATARSLPFLVGVDGRWKDPGAAPGADPAVAGDELIERTSVWGLMGDDGAQGTLAPPCACDERWAPDSGVRIAWAQPFAAPIFQHMGKTLGVGLAPAAAVAASQVLFGKLPAVSVHPLGGCRMADTIEEGVVDDLGRVFDPAGGVHPGLVVLDGAVVPKALGINPALTIAALAERALPHLMKTWGLAAQDAQAQPLPPRPVSRRHEVPAPETVWTIRERLQGPWAREGARPLWARLEIEFDPIPGLRKALNLQRRVVGVRRGVLTLHEGRGDDDAPPLASARLGGTVDLFAPQPPRPGAGDDARVRLVYRLVVLACGGDAGVGLSAGGRLEGVKVLGPTPNAGPEVVEIGPVRQLTEIDATYDGRAVGRWSLDLGHVADRRDPLLSIERLGTMPDALADLAAIGLYALRKSFDALEAVADQVGDGEFDVGLPAQRRPGAWAGGPQPEVPDDVSCWRLSRYRRDGGRPVLLIHGLGMSGSGFTHASIPVPLAKHLFDAGRDVWVLDVRSSIANETGRARRESMEWTVESVAADIPPAIDHVWKETGRRPVDVVAHCMGAVMFVLAALGDGSMAGKVRAAVLSQVGPRARLSASNRLRGFLASYLLKYFGVDEFDAAPPPGPPGGAQFVIDLLVSAFPYDTDDRVTERRLAADPALKDSDFRLVRRRADAIFGQLFEIGQMAPATLAHLGALFGWAKVPMLAQAIHFARLDMLTGTRGRNTLMRRENFRARFDFPLLIVHGRRNAVFDWRGSLRSLKLLRRLRGEAAGADPLVPASKVVAGARVAFYGGGRTRLAVFDDYGHLDCIVGQRAHEQVFPVIGAFLDEHRDAPAAPAAVEADAAAAAGRHEPEAPWLGPMLGWLRAGAGSRVTARVVVHSRLQRARTHGVAVVPVRRTADGVVADTARGGRLGWPNGTQAPSAALDLDIDLADPAASSATFALLTLHLDLPLAEPQPGVAVAFVAAARVEVAGPDGGVRLAAFAAGEGLLAADIGDAPGPAWLGGSQALFPEVQRAIDQWFIDHRADGEIDSSLFCLSGAAVSAADRGKASPPPPALRFALSSCQYPRGLFDLEPAQATWRRLHDDALADDGPQFLLLAGDQVYVDDTAGAFDPVALKSPDPASRAADLDRTYELTWGLPAFRRVAARLPIYPMLDDHEVRDFWQGVAATPPGSDPDVDAALAAYRRFQQPLAPHGQATRLDPAVSGGYVMCPGGVPLVVLDTRTHRDPRSSASAPSAGILQRGTMDSLKRWLQAQPPDAVKLVLSPVPLLPAERFDAQRPAERLRSDTWSGFPGPAAELLGLIRDQGIRRVVLLAGDSHLSSVTTFAFDDAASRGNRVVAIVASGSYTPWPFANQRPHDVVLDGRVEVGLPGQAVGGTMQLHSLSSASGYAHVTLRSFDDGRTTVAVSLRGGDGTTVETQPIVLG
jgi:choline dehydrogenase-like flavoprotein